MLAGQQIISKILNTKDYSMVLNNDLDDTYFIEFKAEFEFIDGFYKEYQTVPDIETFLMYCPNFEIIENVSDPDSSLLRRLKEQHLYNNLAPIRAKFSEMLQHDSFEARDYLLESLNGDVLQTYALEDVDIIEDVDNRVEGYKYTKQNQASRFIPTGFEAIDKDITGLQRGDELVVLFARTNQGKSWILEAIATNFAEQGYRIGYFSPEMSPEDIGYRFDTLHGHFSNTAMKYGQETDNFNSEIYKSYAEKLKQLGGRFKVSRPKDFARRVTVSKLRNWVNSRKLDALFIDGITYLTDERYKKGDSKTTSLTNISEDLMDLSTELGIPITVVVQANRGGVVDKNSLDTPELENIRDSDGIAQNASKVYSIRQITDKSGIINLLIDNKKMRAGKVGQSYSYVWDIDIGEFSYIEKSSIDVDKEEENYSQYAREEKEVSGGNKRDRKRKVEDDY